MGGDRVVPTAPGLGGPAGLFPDPDTGLTAPEVMFGAGQGGTGSVGPDPFDRPFDLSTPTPTANDPGDGSTSPDIRFTNIGATTPSPDYTSPLVTTTTVIREMIRPTPVLLPAAQVPPVKEKIRTNLSPQVTAVAQAQTMNLKRTELVVLIHSMTRADLELRVVA